MFDGEVSGAIREEAPRITVEHSYVNIENLDLVDLLSKVRNIQKMLTVFLSTTSLPRSKQGRTRTRRQNNFLKPLSDYL